MSNTIENFRRDLLTGLLPDIAYRLKISETDQEYINEIKNQLKQNTNLSFILYFNHISYNDPLLASHIVQQIDPKHTRHLIAPASYSHTDPDNPVNKGFTFMINQAKSCGVEIVRVIQAYQVNNPDYGYTREQAEGTYWTWMKRLKELNSNKISTGCLISPEGHRSEDGILGVGETGVVAVGRLLAPVLYIPLGISYDGSFNRNDFNLGRKVNLSIGSIIFQENPKNYPTINEVMHNLAMTLPEEMRGEWK